MSSIERQSKVPRMIVMSALPLLTLLALPCVAAAQLPGAPVLQNAWAAPGIVVALDLGGGSGGSSGTAYAAAAAWAPASARFQLSAGAGIQTGSGSRAVYGARAALPLMQMMGGNLGFAAFAGIGGGATSSGDTVHATSEVPAGIAIGYRRAIGSAGRGFSIFADPNYQFDSFSGGSKGFFRVGVGVDAGITSRFGVTVGLETGTNAVTGAAGPHGSLYGVGVSMKLGR